MRVKAGDPQIHSAITRFGGPTENTWKFASPAPKNSRGWGVFSAKLPEEAASRCEMR